MKLFFVVFAVIIIFIAVLYLLNISKISGYQTGKLPEFTILDDKFRVKEYSPLLGYDVRKDQAAKVDLYHHCDGVPYVLYPDGRIERGYSWELDKLGGEGIMGLRLRKGILFYKNKVYYQDWNKEVGAIIGKKHGEFSNPEMQNVKNIVKMNNDNFLVVTDSEKYFMRSYKLWSVKYDALETKLLSSSLYPISTRPVMCSSGPSEIAHFGIYHTGVYYTGMVRHGWHGDYSRPEKSVIRIYSDSFPDGQDIVEFSFNAGTVVEISSNWINNEAAFIVTTDASLPSVTGVPPVAVRRWLISPVEHL